MKYPLTGGTMKAIVLYLSLVTISIIPGCFVGYESLQNMSESECRSRPGASCPEGPSYDQYQRDLRNHP